MSEIDEYLTARTEFDRCATRVSQLRSRLKSFRDVLEEQPGVALAHVPGDWPTRDDLSKLLGDATAAVDKMQYTWTRVPTDYQKHVMSPPTTLKI